MEGLQAAVLLVLVLGGASWEPLRRALRRARYQRGRKLGNGSRARIGPEDLPWGNLGVPEGDAVRHFLVAGTTGSGKSLLQRRLMAKALAEIAPGSDGRALIFDAKNDVSAFLRKVGVTCPVYTLNPLDSRSDLPQSVAWDIAADVTSGSRALNLAAALVPSERGGANQYFVDAARQLIGAVTESFIRHSPGRWTFPDLVYGTLSAERIRSILERDEEGRETLEAFFGDDRTAYQVFTTVCSRMAYFKPVAALWQRSECAISLRAWLRSESILLLGTNATMKVALDAINELIVRVISEEIDDQENSESRRTWIWLDEARLCAPVLRSGVLSLLAVKGRSKGAALVLGFQDIEGMREAAGTRVANELVAQCTHKALLRMESEESAKWASALLGQFEAIELFGSGVEVLAARRETKAEQRVVREAVLPTEFFQIPVSSKRNGVTGYFTSPERGAVRGTVLGHELAAVVVTTAEERTDCIVVRAEQDQVLRPWSRSESTALGLWRGECRSDCVEREQQPKLKLSRRVPRARGDQLSESL